MWFWRWSLQAFCLESGIEAVSKTAKKNATQKVRPFFGWTFFDPANLIIITGFILSAVFSVTGNLARDAADAYMPLGLYFFLLIVLRGYFFTYYHGSFFWRHAIRLGLFLSVIAAGVLWYDASEPHRMLSATGVVELPYSLRLRAAAYIHGFIGLVLFLHGLIPRRWMFRVTDDIADGAGRDTAQDAPLETIDDKEEAARRAAALEEELKNQ